MEIPCRHGNRKLQWTFHAGISFISGPIVKHTSRYMEKTLYRQEIAKIPCRHGISCRSTDRHGIPCRYGIVVNLERVASFLHVTPPYRHENTKWRRKYLSAYLTHEIFITSCNYIERSEDINRTQGSEEILLHVGDKRINFSIIINYSSLINSLHKSRKWDFVPAGDLFEHISKQMWDAGLDWFM